mgnify:CR=1 FL=1
MKEKLAINGGLKIRKVPMPSRIAFGESEEKEMNKMILHYRNLSEDPKYSGLWEEKFCLAFNKFMGGGYSDAVASGTGAIYIAMKALEIPDNSDVILSPVTCSGAFSCITEQGHRPILVDSSENSYNTDLDQIKKRITKKTKLIQITHSAGEPVSDIEKIAKFAKSNGIYLLEDCSQAIGAKINNKYVGTFGDVAAFSTMYRKNLAANSSSGLVYTKKGKKFYRKILSYADRGKILWNKKLDIRDPKHSLFPALNWNTDEFSCAIGLANIKRLKDTNARRNKFLSKLVKEINKKSQVCYPYNYHQNFSPFYFPIFVKTEKIKVSKIKFAEALAAEGIGLGEHYGCLVSTWPWAQKYLSDKFVAKNSIKARDRCFHLYLNENYGQNELDDIINAIIKVENFYLR